MSKKEHCVLQTHLKQRRALKVRFCEWCGVNSNRLTFAVRREYSAKLDLHAFALQSVLL